jgi:hypothetical protein
MEMLDGNVHDTFVVTITKVLDRLQGQGYSVVCTHRNMATRYEGFLLLRPMRV